MPARTSVLLAVVLASLLPGCTGYRLGGVKPSHLSEVSSINVTMVENLTQTPRAAALATNTLIDALTQDGTYRLATSSTADARLDARLITIRYTQIRSARRDSLRSEELRMEVILEWFLVDGDNPANILQAGRSSGTTRFFVDPNLQTARQNALSDALERASKSVIARIADGF